VIPARRPRLPSRPLRGRVLITEAALRGCEKLLPTYRGLDGDHEGIVFLCGRELGDTQLLTTAIAPRCDHGRQHVMCDERQIEDVVAMAHAHHLGVLAQVHTHPGPFTEHSEGDDEMVLMPFEGMISIVVPHYARC
jgi:proteasome lid subunit RPN8/RPN11